MRTAELRTEHDAAALVAAALRPDDTPEVDTRAVDGAVVTQVERDTTGGLARTVDDYAVNLRVADRLVALAAECENADDTHTT
ncbi:MAG: KEOPS complex subunit Pcc1 [Haloferacaceae archaeon]